MPISIHKRGVRPAAFAETKKAMLSWLSPQPKLPRKKKKFRKGKNAVFPDHGHWVTPPVSLPIEKAIYNEATNFERLSKLLQLPADEEMDPTQLTV